MVLPGQISGASCDTKKTGCETQIHSCDQTCNGPEPVTGHEHVNVATSLDNTGACISLGVKPSSRKVY